MGKRPGGGNRTARNPIFGCLQVGRRRELLAALLRWGSPQSEYRLAGYLAATDQGTPSPDSETVRTARIELRHVHLPALESAGLVSWDRDDGTVATTAHPAFDDPRFERLLALDAAGADDAFAALAHEYRRVALTSLVEGEATATRRELVLEILGQGTTASEERTNDVDRLLHHVHLPKLADLGFIEYDPETSRVTYAGGSALEAVLAVVSDRPADAADKLDGFLGGLHEAYRQGREETLDHPDHQPVWEDPTDG